MKLKSITSSPSLHQSRAGLSFVGRWGPLEFRIPLSAGVLCSSANGPIVKGLYWALEYHTLILFFLKEPL